MDGGQQHVDRGVRSYSLRSIASYGVFRPSRATDKAAKGERLQRKTAEKGLLQDKRAEVLALSFQESGFLSFLESTEEALQQRAPPTQH